MPTSLAGRGAGALLGALIGSAALAEAPVEKTEIHAADRLVVAGFAGRLEIVGEERDDIRLVLRGEPERIRQIRREVQDGALHLGLKSEGSATARAHASASVTVVGPNARATTSVGSVTHSVTGGGTTTVVTGDGGTPLEVRAEVPADGPLVLAGLVGETSVRGVGGPVEVEIAAGKAELERVHDGRLVVQGSGRVEIGEATGDLTAAVRGTGSIEVAKAALGRLEVEVAGVGDVVVEGVAARARLRLAGVGSIRVAEVQTRPDRQVTGVGSITVGNW